MKNKIEDLLKISEKEYGYYQIKIDPLRDKIPRNEIEEIVTESITCGRELALELKIRYGNISIQKLIENIGIEIIRKKDNTSLEYVYFGAYSPLKTITIYENNINQGVKLVQKMQIEDFQEIKFEDIILAHELFHHFEEIQKELFINQYKIELWNILGYKKKSTIRATSEIAAMSFAKTWLELNFSVNILDYILLCPINPELAEVVRKDIVGGVLK